jgi:putative colanic acid biosynthesis acetyltransferase WcaF
MQATMSDQSTQPEAKSPHSVTNRVMRLVWGVVQGTLFRWSPKPLHGWRNLLLRLFGAKLHPSARVYPRAKVWGPWNLVMEERATIADDVDCYCVQEIRIGARSTVSQYSYLCGASHDHTDPRLPLTPMPIRIGSDTWVAADVFVGPGVTIADGVVVGARSSVFGDLPAWTVCVGTPARPIGPRVMKGRGAAGAGASGSGEKTSHQDASEAARQESA